MHPSTLSILTITILLSASLAGCTKTEDSGAFILVVMNETDYDLRRGFYHEGKGAGALDIPAHERGRTNFACPEDNLGPSWNFTLEIRYKHGYAVGEVFAKGTHVVSCNHYTAWIHPDGYILFEKGDALIKYEGNKPVYRPAPWER